MKTNAAFTVSNTFELYGEPLPVECTAETLEQTMHEMATCMACVWGTVDADGMVDLSAHIQGRDEPETGVSAEVDHSNSILDVADENGGKIALTDLVLFIKSDAVDVVEVEENEQN